MEETSENFSIQRRLNESDLYEEEFIFDLKTKIVLTVIYSIMMFVGLIGNILVVIVILKNKDMRKNSTNIFLLNLAFADVILLISFVFYILALYDFAFSDQIGAFITCVIMKF